MAEVQPTFWFHFVEKSPIREIQRLISRTDGAEELADSFLENINSILKDGGLVYPVGIGGDMIAYSRPDLRFVIKFPYDDSSNVMKPRFSELIQERFTLAKRNLGGLFAPSTEVATVLTDQAGERYDIVTMIQQKVVTVKDIKPRLDETGWGDLGKDFIRLTEQMWRRGVFDDDPDWEPNYGFFSDSSRIGMVSIDAGGLSTDRRLFPLHLGLPRTRLYESALKRTFDEDNFRGVFRKNLSSRRFTVRVLL